MHFYSIGLFQKIVEDVTDNSKRERKREDLGFQGGHFKNSCYPELSSGKTHTFPMKSLFKMRQKQKTIDRKYPVKF